MILLDDRYIERKKKKNRKGERKEKKERKEEKERKKNRKKEKNKDRHTHTHSDGSISLENPDQYTWDSSYYIAQVAIGPELS